MLPVNRHKDCLGQLPSRHETSSCTCLPLQMSIKEYRDQLYDNIIARRKQLRKAEKEKYGLTGKSQHISVLLLLEWKVRSQYLINTLNEGWWFAVVKRFASSRSLSDGFCCVSQPQGIAQLPGAA